MDCSSPNAMASLVTTMSRADSPYGIATGNDADADRHGVVTPDGGLLNPNHFLAVAIEYLFQAPRPLVARRCRRQDARQLEHDRPGRRGPRPATRRGAGSASSGSCRGCSTGRSGSAARSRPARASCAATARSGRPTRTGPLLCLLASEITAVTGSTPSQRYADLVGAVRRPDVRPCRRTRVARGEGGAGQSCRPTR